MKINKVLLEVKDLKVYYPIKSGFFNQRTQYVKAVDGINFQVYEGESFGIVGESGCGKSTASHAIVGLLDPHEGEIILDGQVISGQASSLELAKKRQIIFQDPYSSLDPRFTVGRLIAEPLVIHKQGSRQEIEKRVKQLMEDVGLNQEHITRFPHEFSGGQRQRIGVARALALEPSLIVCDEPVSALDVSIQAQILNLMKELQRKYKLTYVFISHDLSVVNHLCDRIAVMYLGNLVEITDKKQLFENPLHPYTQSLLKAIPVPDPDRREVENILRGDVESPLNPPSGCPFHTRCLKARKKCKEDKPQLLEVEDQHFVACHYV